MLKSKFSAFLIKNLVDIKSALYFYNLARSGIDKKSKPGDLKIFSIKNRERLLKIALRANTTDIGTFAEVFHQKIYNLPEIFQPKIIIDIVANIGMASLFLSVKYPHSRIYSFEPSSENLKCLNKNLHINLCENVLVLPYGLGGGDALLPLYQSEEGGFWGCSVYEGKGSTLVESVQIRSAQSAFRELGLEEIDLMKIDCEGAEVDLLKSLNSDRRSKIRVMIGELHPEVSNSYAFLKLLNETHFVDCKKGYGDKCIHFVAVSREETLDDLRQQLGIPYFVR